jgi:hypothetical protein
MVLRMIPIQADRAPSSVVPGPDSMPESVCQRGYGEARISQMHAEPFSRAAVVSIKQSGTLW